MWHLKTTTVPVIVGALGMIKKGTDKHINKIPVSFSLNGNFKIALCGTGSFIINMTEKYHPKEAAKNKNI